MRQELIETTLTNKALYVAFGCHKEIGQPRNLLY